MDGFEIFLWCLGIAFVLFVISLIVEHATATVKLHRVRVCNEHYEGPRTAVGPASNGGVAVTFSGEKCHLELEFDGGHRDFYETDRETLLRLDPNDRVVLAFTYGGISKCVIDCRLPTADELKTLRATT